MAGASLAARMISERTRSVRGRRESKLHAISFRLELFLYPSFLQRE